VFGMTAQRGKDLLLKVDTSGEGDFITVAGLRSRAVAFSTAVVDVTHADSSGRWRELLDGAGVKTARITGAGIFKDQASDEAVRAYFFNGVIMDWQVIIPDFGTVQGLFQITSLEFTGQHDGELAFEIALESAGLLNFTANA
jgi:TP901-1 family phage major tail protein